MSDKITAPKLQKMREAGEKIVTVTAYDFPTAQMADDAGVDVVLVGDSVGNVVLGYETTVPVEIEDIVHHLSAVRRGLKRALLVADLPFGSYQISTEQAVATSIRLMKAGAEAVKLEGTYTEAIAAIVRAGIPVMGHVGLTPQSYFQFGGFRVQGRGSSADRVIEDSVQVQNAGAFSIVLELIPAALAKQITEKLHIPTIGIGAGLECSGQVQVVNDLLGLSAGTMKHAKKYIDGRALFTQALKEYSDEVRRGSFPTEENSF